MQGDRLMGWGLRLRWSGYLVALACALVAISAAALGQAGAGQKNPPGTAVEKSDKPA
jgi:hypothetical protein